MAHISVKICNWNVERTKQASVIGHIRCHPSQTDLDAAGRWVHLNISCSLSCAWPKKWICIYTHIVYLPSDGVLSDDTRRTTLLFPCSSSARRSIFRAARADIKDTRTNKRSLRTKEKSGYAEWAHILSSQVHLLEPEMGRNAFHHTQNGISIRLANTYRL